MLDDDVILYIEKKRDVYTPSNVQYEDDKKTDKTSA